MPKKLNILRKSRWRRAVTALLLLGCCAAFLPMPHFASSQKDQSSPYPCMNRACGCASAEQCWKRCCCFTNQQKVAWAKQNEVAVPSYVVTAARQETTLASSKPNSNCDQCRKSGNSQNSSCETVADESSLALATKPNQPSVEQPVRYFSGISALECQGLTSLLQILTLCAVPWSHSVSVEGAVVSEMRLFESARLPQQNAEAPEPPPRLGVVG